MSTCNFNNPANRITFFRIILSLVLLFLRPFSALFKLVYLICGISDMCDGAVARRTGTVSKEGAMLDSCADIVFVAVCLYKIVPALKIGVFIWFWMGIIAAIRIYNIVVSYKINNHICLLHTFENRLTGVLLFILPLMGNHAPKMAIPVCIIATYAAIKEGCLIHQGQKE